MLLDIFFAYKYNVTYMLNTIYDSLHHALRETINAHC